MNNTQRIGKLKFKQTIAKPLHPLPPKHRKHDEDKPDQLQDVIEQDQLITHEPTKGTGTLTTSGRTIHGLDTKFREQLENGDYIIITNPVFKTSEERQVTLVLSSKSLLLDSPFLEEYSSFVPFQIRKKTTVIPGENVTQKYKEQLQELTKTKQIKKEEISLRIKKGMWAYKTQKVPVQQNLTREQQLDLRQKMIKDKHCW